MRLDAPMLGWLAPVIGLMVLAAAWWARHRRIRAAAAWSGTRAELAGQGRIGLAAVSVGALLIGLGVAGPRWGRTETSTEARALNVVIAIDISRSMLAEDAVPNRLGHAVRESRRLLQDARGDRMALLAFAGRSYILTPLTLDDGAVELQLDALDPEVASEGGTAIATVLRQGRELLEAVDHGGARAMVLFTDGETHDSLGPVREAARSLRDAGVTLIVVGAGGVTPTRIPLRDAVGQIQGYVTDQAGQDVLSSRRDDVLRLVADAARGILVPADFPDQAGAVWKTLAALERSPTRGQRAEDMVPKAWVFALGAFAILLVQAAWRRRAALVAIAWLAILGGEAAAQRPAPGVARLRVQDTARSIAAFSEAARAGRAADTSWYNAGSLALIAGDYDAARTSLAAATESLDPMVRFQALYNLGLAALQSARADTARRSELEQQAAQHLREALTIAPTSFATKWNLELASRRRPPPPSSSQPQPTPPRPEAGAGTPTPRPAGMTAAEAEQILRSVERAEQSVRAEQLRRRRVARSAADKDW
ncbi:MAG: VWA domain-containing protein [Gemmatimonadales bacterium]|nr:VWA domain-containing protein [Gemmatimonadales bacterium]